MLPLILRYGVIAGLIVAAPMLGLYFSAKPGEPHVGGWVIGYLTMLVALTMVFLGIKHYRDKVSGGVIRFLPALGLGLGISFVASLFYVAAWEICMAKGSAAEFIASYRNEMVEAARATAKTPEALASAIADADSFAKNYTNPPFRMAMTFIEIFPVGLLISLISAAVLRNPRVLPARTQP